MFEPTSDAILWLTNTLLDEQKSYENHKDLEIMERSIRSKFWKKTDPLKGMPFRHHLIVKPTTTEDGDLTFDFYPSSTYGKKLVIGMTRIGQQVLN